jgi:hypothetical protein
MIDSDDENYDPTEYSASSVLVVPTKRTETNESRRTKEGFYLAEPHERITEVEVEPKIENKKRRRINEDSCSEEEVLEGITMDSFQFNRVKVTLIEEKLHSSIK